jgi:peroxiredoxin
VAGQKPVASIPSFTFFRNNNAAFTNSHIQNGKMLFFVFFDVTCHHCRHAIKYINQNAGRFNKVAVYLITLDGWDKVTSFMGKYGPQLQGKKNVTVLRDARNEFINKFGRVKYPSLFLFSAQKN